MERGKLGGWRRGTPRDRALPACPRRVFLIVLFCGAFAASFNSISRLFRMAKFLIDNGSRD
jgi:hypothetical protein